MPPATRTTAAEATPSARWPDVRSIPGKVTAVNSPTFTWKCPAIARWRVVAFICRSTADATGVARFWQLAVTDQNATQVLAVASGLTLPVSTAVLYAAARNWPRSVGPDGGNVYTDPLPDMFVEHDWTLTASYIGAGVADVIGPANLLVEQSEA